MSRRFARVAQSNVGLILFLLGGFMILVAQTFDAIWAKVKVDETLAAIGAAIIFTAALQWLFDVFSKPHLFREIAERALGNEHLVSSGLRNYFSNSKAVDYSEAIANDDDLVVSVNYSPRLLDDYFQLLKERVASGKTLTVIALASESRGYEYLKSWDGQAGHILPNLEKIERRIKEIAGNNRDKVFLIRHPKMLSYSFVATRRVVWFKLYRNSTGPAIVPAFCAGHGTELFKFFWADIDSMKREASQ